MMPARLLFSIVKTHLLSRKKQTITSTAGVMLGILMYIFMVSFIVGLNEYFSDIMLAASPHVRFYTDVQQDSLSITERFYKDTTQQVFVHHQKPKSADRTIKKAPDVINYLKKVPNVIAVSPRVSTPIYYTMGQSNLNGMLTGIDINAEQLLFQINTKLVDGSFESLLNSENTIALGISLAKKMQVSVGDRVLVTLPNGVVTYVQVGAVFKWGMTAIDNTQGFASVQTVQKLMQKNASFITDIYVKFVNPNEAPIKAEEWRAVFDETQIEDWKSTLAEIESTNKLRNMITVLVVVTLLTVSGFGIYNIQTMMIFERMKDIAILRAIGLQGNDIRLIFLIEALFIGLLGSILGLISGFLICYAVSKIPYHVDVVITIDHLPIQFKTIYYVSGFMFGIITTAIAGYFPSKRASKIDPVEIIRG